MLNISPCADVWKEKKKKKKTSTQTYPRRDERATRNERKYRLFGGLVTKNINIKMEVSDHICPISRRKVCKTPFLASSQDSFHSLYLTDGIIHSFRFCLHQRVSLHSHPQLQLPLSPDVRSEQVSVSADVLTTTMNPPSAWKWAGAEWKRSIS